MTKALIIIAKDGFQDLELRGVRNALLAAGFDVVLSSMDIGTCEGKFGSNERSEIALRDVVVTDYDRIVFIGGPGAERLVGDIDVERVVHDTVEAGLPLGAICLAPTILAEAGVLDGKKATVWDDGERTQIEILERNGATYTGESVATDGCVMTANGPEAAEEFGAAFATLGKK